MTVHKFKDHTNFVRCSRVSSSLLKLQKYYWPIKITSLRERTFASSLFTNQPYAICYQVVKRLSLFLDKITPSLYIFYFKTILSCLHFLSRGQISISYDRYWIRVCCKYVKTQILISMCKYRFLIAVCNGQILGR